MNTPPPADPPDLTGRTLGDFHVLRKLGQGGMGRVYLARQLSLKREVALKLLSADLANDPTALKRFQAEAEAVARATHANIVQVYAVGEHDGLRYMALEYVPGRNLREFLDRKGPPELPVALNIIRQVAAALQRASELGLVHRDIKPENILVTKRAEAKVTDFGLSREAPTAGGANLTRSGMTLGTPLYMSPEQVQGLTADHRSDIYSFGVTCYHLLAGHPPFRGSNPFQIAAQHVQAEPPPLSDERPDLASELCSIVHKMMAKRPEDRYQTARDVIRDVAKLQQGMPVGQSRELAVSATTVVPVPGPAPAAGLWWAARAVLLAGLAATGWWGFSILHPAGSPLVPATGPGLPTTRPQEPVITAKERELLATLASRSSTPAEVFDATIDLGLLYIRERRLDEADKLFKDVEQDKQFGKGPAAVAPTVAAGQLGQAIVLAHRDKAKESNDLAEKTTAARPRTLVLEKFLLHHPEFAQALAEALTRNAENLGVAKLPDRLEWLRTPAGVIRGGAR